MDDVDALLKATVGELDRLLDARHVLGEPIERDGRTVIPLVSYGFGFGAGGAQGGKGGPSSGTGAGGGIKPVGAIILGPEGARVEAVRSTMTTLAETLSDAAMRAMDRSGKARDAADGGGD